MAQTPENLFSLEEKCSESISGQRVVISGMAGLYPESHSVKDLSDILYNKINPVTKENSRWKYKHPEISQYTGKVPGPDKFDANFFKVHYRLSQNMEPMVRKLLEKSFEAIYDAGICPYELSGKKIAVFIGISNCETEKTISEVKLIKSGVGITGCGRAMYANRISYWLNINGPSLTVDELCCSSTRALEQGYLAIKSGQCEAAIVGGASLNLVPQAILHTGRMIKISMDGKTKSFDTEAAGCAKSEAISVLFLQKAENALRIYADVVHVKSEFISLPHITTGPKFGFYRDPENMACFIKNFYEEAQVLPQIVEYIDAFGSADPHADKAELEAIEKVYCHNRNEPLLVGSVMSNIGYTEGVSGIAAITKILLGYQYGQLAANMHCDSPRKDLDSLCDGRMRIITDHETFRRTYAAVNNMSLTGINCHTLLCGHNKPKDTSRYKANFPQLVTLSGRQETSVNKIIQDLKSRPIDPEELALLRNIHKSRITGHLGRGFVLLDTNEKNHTICLQEKLNYFDDAMRPLWFVYSGMGCQWVGMGAQLMRIPVFAAAIERCQHVLEPKGVDIIHIITSSDNTVFDNILHSFVGIAAIQIGLTDILRELKIFPDMIIGHSLGELGCAYADGCFTAEEMILAAYSRGLVFVQNSFIRGSMAAVGIGYQKISKMCPPEIDVACHNGPDSSTISGPADIMKEFVAQLRIKGIFAKEVQCSNFAYHSRYIAAADTHLLKYLSEVITSPKARSKRWVSTSVPQDKWNDPIAKYSSAEYHTNNLLNPVLFEETSRLIPENAVVVEIAPHGILQAILKRSLPQSCTHVPLTRRGHSDNAQYLLEAIGNLYMEGFNPHVQSLYPKVSYPVSNGTPMLSHLVEWEHSEQWNVLSFIGSTGKSSAFCTHAISIHDDEHRYLKGHVIRGNNTYPFAATLVVVWDTLAMVLGLPKKQFSVHFSDVHLHTQPVLHDQRLLRLNVAIHRGKGRFEVLDGNIKVATGFVIGELDKQIISSQEEVKSEEVMELNSNDIYQYMYSRDYNYSSEFRSIYEANTLLTKAHLLWQESWVTLIDGMIQLNALQRFHESISQPIFIKSINIDVKKHLIDKKLIQNNIVLPAHVSDCLGFTRCGGVLIENLKFYDLPPAIQEQTALRTLKFVPHFTNNSIDEVSAICVFMQILADHLNKRIVNVVEVIDHKRQIDLNNNREIIHNIPEVEINYLQISRDDFIKETDIIEGIDLLMTNNLADDDNMCQVLLRTLNQDTFLINKETSTELSTHRSSLLYRRICAHTIGSQRLELNIWQPSDGKAETSTVTVFSHADLAKVTGQLSMLPFNHKLVIVCYPAFSEIKDVVRKCRNKDNRKINLVIINPKYFDEQSLNQMQFTDLAINILENGVLGGEYYLPIQENIVTGKDSVALDITRLGDIDSMRWIEMKESNYPGIPVKVHYVGLNDVYVKQVLGVTAREYKDNKKLVHYDFSGTTDRNVRVMGIVQDESIKARVKVKPELLWPVPEHWSLEDAATVPLAYCLAFYCLCFKSRLYPGNSILVHGGAGALGQAIISIALAHECNIYTTVSDIKKKQFLLKLFPELKEDHIGYSRDNSFIDMTSRGTNGKGCDIVISSVKGDLRNASIRCCKLSGFIVDTSLIIDGEDYAFGMFNLVKAITYSTMQFSTLFDAKNLENLQRLQLMVSEGIARGYVRPLSRVVYPAGDPSRALCLQTSSTRLGRVLLYLEGDITYTQHKISCSSDKLHMLFSENDILGLQLANRLIDRGARKLIIHCSNKSNIYLFKLSSWEKRGVQCSISYGNAWDENIPNLLTNKTLHSVEGIYFILNSNTQNERIDRCLNYLTLNAGRSNWPIRYSAVIDARKEMSDLTKTHDLFMTIKMSSLKIFESVENEENFQISNAIDAMEKALCCKQRVLAIHARHMPICNLLQEVVRLAGLSIPNGNNTSEEVTLKDLGMDVSKSQIIRAYLRDVHYCSLDESSIPLLTINNIRELQEKSIMKTFTETEALSTFFSYKEPDELLATLDTVVLPTHSKNPAVTNNELEENCAYLCIIPGVDGLHVRFYEFCERLKLPALVLQPGLDIPHETIQEMAQRYAKILMKKAKLKKRFYLVGYESGILVALEMAAIFEDHGLTGIIYCIGGAPDDILEIFKEKLNRFETDQSLQVAVANHMFHLMNNDAKPQDLLKDLNNISTWKAKVSLCVQKLLGRIDHSIGYAKELIEAAYARIVQVRRYKSEPRVLRSLLISIRTVSSGPHHVKPLSLQKHSQQRVVEYELHVPLAYAAQDLRCAAIVNRHLDMDILEEFDKSNLCETSFTIGDSLSNNNKECIDV